MTNPNRPPNIQTDYVSIIFEFLGKLIVKPLSQLSKIGFISQPLQVLIRFFSNRVMYVYALWIGASGFPFVEDVGLLANQGWLVGVPLLLNLVVVVLSIMNTPCPLNSRMPREVWSLIFFALPYFNQINVTRQKNRPYWSCLALWVSILMLLTALKVGSFVYALSGLGVGVMAFSALIF
jgi:hypothetical protein